MPPKNKRFRPLQGLQRRVPLEGMTVAVRLPDRKRLCGTAEAAELYGCTRQHIVLMAKRKQIWCKRVSPKSTVYDADQIEQLARERSQLRNQGKLGGRRPGDKKSA